MKFFLNIFLLLFLIQIQGAEKNFLGVSDAEIQKIRSVLNGKNCGIAPKISDREFWAKYPVTDNTCKEAERLLKLPMPGNSAQWKDFSHRIAVWTIMEAKENNGRYLNAVAECLELYCKKYPWSQGATRLYGEFKKLYTPRTPVFDLFSCRKYRDISEAYWILQDKLPEKTVKLVKDAMEEQCFAPFRKTVAEKDFKKVYHAIYLRDKNNWNPFVNIGVLNAAAVFLQGEDLALFLANIKASLEIYIRNFDDDGYQHEGVGYYAMGVSRLLDCQEMFMKLTDGRCDIFAPYKKKMEKVFQYPFNFSMDGNILYPPFADSGVDGLPQNEIPSYLRGQLDLHSNQAANAKFYQKDWSVNHGMCLAEDIARGARLMKLRSAKLPDTAGKRSDDSFFRRDMVVVCRNKDGFSFAAKGGYNFEDHNHNDLGSFCIGLNGRIICGDPGVPVYNREYFASAKGRYANQFASSWGHPVPVVAGQFQSPGTRRTKVLEYSAKDGKVIFKLDLKVGYPNAKTLQKLHRTFIYTRKPAQLQITDEFEFSQPEKFGAALISYDKFNISGKNPETENLQFSFAADCGELLFSNEKFTSKARGKKIPQRLGYDLKQPAGKGSITVTIKTK
ncbi:MAG: heparinase II/III family protein [Lentisphaeria bacterium]|nr:heparinase II/III family protein [Lentisphaeria bacterium]